MLVGHEVFYPAPLYHYFLGLVQLIFGHNLGSNRLIRIALGTISCGFLYVARTSFLSHGAGVAAGLS
jgi:hypothetical protein